MGYFTFWVLPTFPWAVRHLHVVFRSTEIVRAERPRDAGDVLCADALNRLWRINRGGPIGSLVESVWI